MKRIPLLKKLIEFVRKYSPNKRIIREQLDGHIAMQIASSAVQIPGEIFQEYKSVSVRNKYGTS